MSESRKEGQRTGRGDDRAAMPRRLRSVSAYPDPFLVTKLPLEGRVSAGVIRLGDRTILGFVEDPFPEGSRVRVVYQGWLMAELLEPEEPRSQVEEQVEEQMPAGESPWIAGPPVEGESHGNSSSVEEEEIVAGESTRMVEPDVEGELHVDSSLLEDQPESVQHGEPSRADEYSVPAGDASTGEGPSGVSPVDDADDYPLERGPLHSEDGDPWEQMSRGSASRNGSMRAGGGTPAPTKPPNAAQREREQESVQPDLFPDDLTESEGSSARSGGDWVDAFSRKREHE